MDTQSLPLVPFGKYKGKPVTELLNDSKYLEWCKQQEFFKKYQVIYNICVNQTITTNQNSKTPEHNKLQNLFLEQKNIEKLLRLIYKDFRYSEWLFFINEGSNYKCEFEGKFNWDIIINDYLCYPKKICKCYKKDEDFVCKDECYQDKDYQDDYVLPRTYIEIKPLLGDDYPCVLRKMKLQKELTKTHLENEKKRMLDTMNFFEKREFLEYESPYYSGKYILLIKEYNSTTTSKEQLVKIFKQSNIQVIFINELFENLQNEEKNEEKNEEFLKEKLKNLEKENIILQESLSQSKEQIKKLEEEILLLKNSTK